MKLIYNITFECPAVLARTTLVPLNKTWFLSLSVLRIESGDIDDEQLRSEGSEYSLRISSPYLNIFLITI
jgi:hypothetical protein